MAVIYYEKDCDLSYLKDRMVGIIGYGSQGHAQAQNLRDSGVKVLVAEMKGSPAFERAEKDGFKPASASEVAKAADYIVMLAPDTIQPKIYQNEVLPGLTVGASLCLPNLRPVK